MSHNKRKSPNSIPRTEQDCIRREEKGRREGGLFFLSLVLFVLSDKHRFPPEEIEQLGNEVNFYAEQINKGEIKVHEVNGALKFEYGLEVKRT